MFVIGVRSMLSQTKEVGMGCRSHDLYGVDSMILRIFVFSPKIIKLFFVGPESVH